MAAQLISSARSLLKTMVGAAVTVVTLGTGSPALAQNMELSCAPNTDEDLREIVCDFRFSEPVQLEELTISADGSVLEGSAFTPYSGTGSKSAWLYLVDRSNPRRAATVARNIDIVRDQLRISSPTRLVGLATFANDLELVYSPSASHSALDQTLSSITANGAATEFFANSLEAIKILDGVEADRKALVIMSDGKAEDKAYTRQDVIDAAKKAGVTIIGLGFAEAASQTPDLQEIRRLADETNGYFASVVGDEAFPADLLNNLTRYLENGGVVRAPLGEVSGTLQTSVSAIVQGGQTITASSTIEAPAPAAPPVIEEPAPEPTLIGNIYSAFEGVWPGAAEWAENNNGLAWLLLAALPILALVLLAWYKRGEGSTGVETPQHDDPLTANVDPDDVSTGILDDPFDTENSETRHVSAVEAEMSGHFEVVGSEDNKFRIEGHSVSIGRHSDNDIQLSNDSVHRHHAHFHISPDGVPTIHDLDTANGVVVNGERVEKSDLKSGDVVELGEVRLRYVSGEMA